MILLFGSNLASYPEQIHGDEKILKMTLRVHAACGVKILNRPTWPLKL